MKVVLALLLLVYLLNVLRRARIPAPSRHDASPPQPLQIETQKSVSIKKEPLFGNCQVFAPLNDEVFRAQCKEKIEAATGPEQRPTTQQWEMILSPATSTYVVAGAGSGKSTTLAYRVLLMNKLLNIPLNEIRVFSFTKASVRDFRKTLLKAFYAWEKAQGNEAKLNARTKKSIESVVTTFHSTALNVYKQHTGDRGFRLFEFLGKDDINETHPYNPLIPLETTDDQERILIEAHVRTWRQNEQYRTTCRQLLAEQDRRAWVSQAPIHKLHAEKNSLAWFDFLKREKEYHCLDESEGYHPPQGFRDTSGIPHVDPYRATVANWLNKHGKKFVHAAKFQIMAPPRVSTGRHSMYAAFKVGDIYLHVCRFRPQERSPLSVHEWHRKRIINTYCDDLSRINNHKLLPRSFFEEAEDGTISLTPSAERHLLIWLDVPESAPDQAIAEVAQVEVQLAGMIKPEPIAYWLFDEGRFTESLGLEVRDLKRHPHAGNRNVALTVKMLAPFWEQFEKILEEQSLVRFHQVFAVITQKDVSKDTFLKHLLIDEFQDASPEIIGWLQVLLAKHSKKASLLCVGDDWQSIYGWRGSNPGFFIHFEEHFAAPTTRRVYMEDNFRSRQPIIDAAEHLVARVTQKIPKKGRSRIKDIETGPGLEHPVKSEFWCKKPSR